MSWTVRLGSSSSGQKAEAREMERMRLGGEGLGLVGQPTNFNRSDLDEAVAELPAMGIRLKHAKDGLKRSMSADQMSDGSARVSHKRADSVLLTPKTEEGAPRSPEESIYHPPYEYGASFADASTVKANLVPLVLTTKPRTGGGLLSEIQDARMKAISLRLESKQRVKLRDVYPFYSGFEGPDAQADGSSESEPLPNLDWTSEGSHLKFRYLMKRRLCFHAPRASDGLSALRKKGGEDEASVPLAKQWECLRLYMQPLVSLGILVDTASASGAVRTPGPVLDNEALGALFGEMAEAYPALAYFILKVDESVDTVGLLSGAVVGEDRSATLYTFYHQALGELSYSSASLSDDDSEIRCSLDSVMHRVGASLLRAMEWWITKASPASLALTTPIDLLNNGDLGSSSISEHEKVSHMKYSHIGRLKKELGDYCLCVRSADDALVHYAVALDVTKECGDILWHASALEGTCATDVCAFFRDTNLIEPISLKKLEQLWLSTRQACEQAANLYKSLPTLRASLLLKTAQFGSQLRMFSEPWSYFSFMTTIQVERYIQSVVDSLPGMRIVSNEESVALCLLDIAKIYDLCSKKRKVAQFMLLAASSYPEEQKELILHLTVSAGHVYGLDNDFQAFCNWKLLKRWGLVDLYTGNLTELGRHQRRPITWPKLIQTVQFGIISNALSQGNRILAAKAAFYFLHLWMESLQGEALEKRTAEWLCRVMKCSGDSGVYHETKYSLDFITSMTLCTPGNFVPKFDEPEGKQKGVFLYDAATANENKVVRGYEIPSGQLVRVSVTLTNPFPPGLHFLCQLVVEKEEGEVTSIGFASEIKLRGGGQAEVMLSFIPKNGPGKVRVTGARFTIGGIAWVQDWTDLPALHVCSVSV